MLALEPASPLSPFVGMHLGGMGHRSSQSRKRVWFGVQESPLSDATLALVTSKPLDSPKRQHDGHQPSQVAEAAAADIGSAMQVAAVVPARMPGLVDPVGTTGGTAMEETPDK